MAEEKTYENRIKEYIRQRGGYVLKTFGNGYQASGTPDLICCINGNFVAIEVKSAKGVVSKLQEKRIDEIRSAGGVALIAYPKDWEKLKKIFNILILEKQEGTENEQKTK